MYHARTQCDTDTTSADSHLRSDRDAVLWQLLGVPRERLLCLSHRAPQLPGGGLRLLLSKSAVPRRRSALGLRLTILLLPLRDGNTDSHGDAAASTTRVSECHARSA